MNILRNIERISLLHKLIKEEKTGTPDCLSRRLSLSRGSLYNLLEELKSMDAPISYSRSKESFFYNYPFEIELHFQIKTLDKHDMKEINGGFNLFSFRPFY